MNGTTLTDALDRTRRSSRLERLRARAPRYAFMAACVVLSLLGLRGLIFGGPAQHTARASGVAQDPAMESFALEFARSYLAYDAERPQAREARLASFVPDYLGPDAGFSPLRGSQQVLWAQVAQNQSAIAGGRILTVAVQTDGRTAPVYLAVPVERRGGGLLLAGYPSFVGPPAVATAADEPTYEPVEDQALVETAHRVVANYLGRSAANLRADLSPEASVSLPASPLRVSRAGDVVWADEAGGPAVLASVEVLDDDGNAYSLVYELGVASRGERWYASWIEVVPDAR